MLQCSVLNVTLDLVLFKVRGSSIISVQSQRDWYFFITCCCVFLRQKCLRILYSVDTTAIAVMWSSLCKLSIDSVDMCFFQEEITDPAASEIPNSSTAISVETVSEPDPFRKFRDIRHQDFGEIVFRKTKKSKKKANKGMFIKWIFPKPNPVND